MLKLIEIEVVLPFSLSRKVITLVLQDRWFEGSFSLHARCATVGALSPTSTCTDGAFSLHGRCTGVVSREKNGASKPFLKVDEVDVYPYHLGEMEFGS